MTDLEEIKDLWAMEKVKPHDKQITHDHIDWLIAKVERLEAATGHHSDVALDDAVEDGVRQGMEQAAKIVESYLVDPPPGYIGFQIAAAIRADKERGDE